ncbi:MAG: hypothetical protein AB7H88_00610 [Vicinamibacterales bacterium]
MPRCARAECGRWRPDLLVRNVRVGLHLDNRWYCSPGCVETATRRRLSAPRPLSLRPPAIPPLRLGTLLIHLGAATPALLRQAADAQRRSGLRIGAQLRAMGVVSATDVLRGLSAQAGVGYLTHLDPSCVREAPGRLSADAVRALGVVPVEADAHVQRLRVACVAPVPRVAIAALYELTRWAIEPFLVSDEHLEPLMTAYAEAAGNRTPAIAAHTVRRVDEAAKWVARAAAAGPGVRMTEARFDPYQWVRLESEARVEDVLISGEAAGG